MNLHTLLFAAALIAPLPATAQTPFGDMGDELGLSYTAPDGFVAGVGAVDPVFTYQVVLTSAESGVEIRYALRPLARIEIDYIDPHGATPEPNHLYPLMFSAYVDQLAYASSDRRREYSPEQSRLDFGADWAAAAIFDLPPGYSDTYDEGFLLALHKSRKGDIYALYLYSDPEQLREVLATTRTAVRFVDDEGS